MGAATSPTIPAPLHRRPAHRPNKVQSVCDRVRGKLKLGFHIDQSGAAVLLRLPGDGDLHDLIVWLDRFAAQPAKQRRVFMQFVRTGLGLSGETDRFCDADVSQTPITADVRQLEDAAAGRS